MARGSRGTNIGLYPHTERTAKLAEAIHRALRLHTIQAEGTIQVFVQDAIVEKLRREGGAEVKQMLPK